MSKKNNKVKVNVELVETVVTNEVVFVRVIKNFNDATDNNNFVAAGKNTFYRTNKERADMLVNNGYAEYDNVVVEDIINDDDNANNNEDDSNVIDNSNNDNANDNVDDNNNDDITNDDNNPNE